jgi:hypothetical protein
MAMGFPTARINALAIMLLLAKVAMVQILTRATAVYGSALLVVLSHAAIMLPLMTVTATESLTARISA